MKQTQSLALIALVTFLFFKFVSPYLVAELHKLLPRDIRTPTGLMMSSIYPGIVYLLGNIGFGHWLSVLAKGTSGIRIVWFLFGLFLGINAVMLYYVLILVHSTIRPVAETRNA